MSNTTETKPAKLTNYPHSISAANTYRQCGRLYYNRYVLGWTEAAEQPWLKFGTCIDNLLEVLDTSNLQQALQAIPDFFPDAYDQLDAKVLLTLFQAKYGHDELPPVDLHGKPGNQYPFYVNYNGNEVTGLISMTISGKIDKVTLIDGEIGVMEGKTTAQPVTESSAYWKKLEMDPQIACYVWGLSKELGKPVNWVWYQVIRRPSSTANPLFARTRVSKGVVTPFTLAEYEARVMQLIHNPENLENKPLMARRKLYISEDRKALWVTEHAQTWQEIQERKGRQALLVEQGLPGELAWPRNHLGCESYGGCPFWDVCIGKTTIEGSNKFTKRNK